MVNHNVMKNIQFLMCPPDYFNVEYEINPWMRGQFHKARRELAQKQWHDFCTTLKKYADVLLMPAEKNLPDLVFTANAGSIFEKRVLLSHFRYPERQGEEEFYKKWFVEQKYAVLEMPNKLFFEGGGDVLPQPGMPLVWMGFGFRSDKGACTVIKDFFKSEIIGLQLIDNRFYHLDTCLCPLLDGELMYFPQAFDEESLNNINKTCALEKQIKVTEEDATKFACNAVLIETPDGPTRGVIILNEISQALKDELEQRQYKVIEQPVSEFLRAGGATRCLTLRLN